MRRVTLSMALALASVLTIVVPLRASDPVGVFAVVQRVVMEPATTTPARVQVWGAFAVADIETSWYSPAEPGYFYFACPAGQDKVCASEWADFKAKAGTGDLVAFASRYGNMKLHVRKADEKPVNPDPYPINIGLTKLTNATFPANYQDMFKALKDAAARVK